jgi:capsular exopolysaccharide synthesis family protein
MMQDENSSNLDDTNSEGPDTTQTLLRFLRYWPWILLCVVIGFAGAKLYLRYTVPIYTTSTQIKILDDSDDGGLDLSGMSGSTTLFNMNKINLANEMYIFQSKRLLEKVVDSMDLNTYYYSQGQIKSELLFEGQIPFKVHWEKNTQNTSSYTLKFKENGDFLIYRDEENQKTYSFGDTIAKAGHKFSISFKTEYNDDLSELAGSTFSFHRVDSESMARKLSSSITIAPLGQQSDILNATITGPNKTRNEAILNNLVNQFNQDGIEDNRLVSKRTAEFIKDRLVGLTQELDTVEGSIVDFKQKGGILSVEANSQQLFTKESTAEAKKYELQNQLEMAKEFQKALDSNDQYELLPANIGIQNSSVSSLTNQYNQLILKKQDLSVSATSENKMILQINDKLDQLLLKIDEGIQNYLKSLRISIEQSADLEQRSSGRLSQMPEKEKRIRSIERNRIIKEQLYLFLLQRREEAKLSYAITAPTVKVVDYAYTTGTPIKPQDDIIIMSGVAAGLILPLAVLYLIFMLDSKVKDKDGLKREIKEAPILSELPYIQKGGHKWIKPNDRTALAESFRILRTNLAYFKSPKKGDEAEVVFVTSTTKGEGKTFAALNLANTWASTGKKTLLLGCDLRNPQIHNTLNLSKDTPGVSSFLYEKNIEINDLVIKKAFEFDNLDTILSGNIPPNPAELLLNGRFDEMIEELKTQYDYIVVDTAPTLLVTDTLLISKHADVTAYIIRADFTDKKLLKHIKDLKSEKKINSMGLVLNGVKEKGAYGYGYNYGYGYGYGADDNKKSPFWKFWKK